MASVDDRIVRLEFDNASFEKKVSSTLASLSQLDKALQMTGAQKGLTEVSAAAEKMNFAPISQGIEHVSKGFLAMATIAITAISSIVNKAIDAGLQIAKSLAIQPVMQGFQEYELKMGAIQTIIAGSGESLEVVNEKLKELNEYSDKTIYSFKDMTTNIGKFTNAGVSLDQAVASIKGVANVAALSGANAEEASRAMYNFAQALSKGHVALIDWKSIELANMGTAEFKQQLIDAGEAMGTLTKEGDHWVTTAGKSVTATKGFNESLTDEWLTTEALNKTLGDYSDVTTDIGKKATLAATEVKTFTMLMSTLKETVGSGFAQSFEIIIGDFEEAKALWTDVNDAVGGFINKMSDARNELLQGWKDMGGRTVLIEALSTAFRNLGLIIQPIKDAFRDIFPAMTAQTLYDLTTAFSRFATALAPTAETVDKIRSAFKGLFAIWSIWFEIIKEGIKFVIALGKALLGIISPGTTSFFAKLGEGIAKLQESLVKGGKIKDFFESLTRAIQTPVKFLGAIRDALGDVFGLFKEGAAVTVGALMDRLGDRFQSLHEVMGKAGDMWEPFGNALSKIIDVLERVWDVIRDWFKQLGQKLADVMGKGDFDAVLDAINTGLLGGIALLLAKFIKSGFSFDIGGGFLEKIGDSFEQLTGVLSAMQAKLKADALIRIAIAIGILTASLVALSMIDSVKLAAALTAMGVGFGELLASFTLFTKVISGPISATTFTIMSAGLIMLATAMLILSAAVLVFSTMDLDELAIGLTGFAGSLVILVGAVKLLQVGGTGGMISAGIGIAAIGTGMLILSAAMKVMATMDWEELGKGLTGVALGLGTIIAAMKLMPKDAKLISTGVGILVIAGAMLLLSASVAIFGKMNWETIGKGLLTVGIALAGIAGAMHLMPPGMAGTAAALVLVATALLGIATTMKMIAGMKWGEIAKGLGVIAISLGILIGTMYAITGAIAGAATLVIITAALAGFAMVIKMYASMKIMDMVKGIGAIAVVLGLLALASWALSESIPVLLLFGAALALIGIGIAGVGIGIYFLAKGFQVLAEACVSLGKSLPDVLEAVGKALPALIKGFAEGIVELAMVFVKAAPIFAKMIGTLLEHIIDTIVKLMPKLAIIVDQLMTLILDTIEKHGPRLIDIGLMLIENLLKGIRANIGQFTHIVGDIITKFLNAFQAEIPRVAEELAQTLITMYTQAAEKVGEVAGTLLFGVGIAFMTGFFNGLGASLGPVTTFFAEIGGKIIGWIGNALSWLVQKGKDTIQGLLDGINNIIGQVTSFFNNLPGNVTTWAGNMAGALIEKGRAVIDGLLQGMQNAWGAVTGWLSGIGTAVRDAVGAIGGVLRDIGEHIMNSFLGGLQKGFEGVKDFVGGIGGWIADHKGPPAYDKVMLIKNGELIMQGLHTGLKSGFSEVDAWLSTVDSTIEKSLGGSITKALSSVADKMSDISEFAPTITPVLDLTEVAAGASKIGDYISTQEKLMPTFSYGQARTIANAQNAPADNSPTNEPDVRGSVQFTQINNSPTQLSTSDIYKQTRNQIRIAKEELSIP